MTHIWRALIDNPKQAVDEHFAAIVKEVLTEMGGRLWRNREAACSALSDLVQVHDQGENHYRITLRHDWFPTVRYHLLEVPSCILDGCLQGASAPAACCLLPAAEHTEGHILSWECWLPLLLLASIAWEPPLQGRRWAQLESHLQEMWVMTMRAMDDVKESCRAAAAITIHTLPSVTLRLADPAATATEDAAKAMNMMLPFLLSTCRPLPSAASHAFIECMRLLFAAPMHMLRDLLGLAGRKLVNYHCCLPAGQKSDAKEVQAVCMISIAKMVQAAKAAQIQAHLVQLVPALLESLSSMEVSGSMQSGTIKEASQHSLLII